MCEEWGYKELAKKNESYEICFIPDNDYRGFLKRRVPDLEEKVSGGLYVDSHGNLIGQHEGYPFYTIGQRKGLGVAFGEPVFVTEINAHTNRVTLGTEEELRKSSMKVCKVNLQKYASLPDGLQALVKVRYKDAGTRAKVYDEESEMLNVKFELPVKAISPGQSAVMYEGNDVVGGGIIHSVLK